MTMMILGISPTEEYITWKDSLEGQCIYQEPKISECTGSKGCKGFRLSYLYAVNNQTNAIDKCTSGRLADESPWYCQCDKTGNDFNINPPNNDGQYHQCWIKDCGVEGIRFDSPPNKSHYSAGIAMIVIGIMLIVFPCPIATFIIKKRNRLRNENTN